MVREQMPDRASQKLKTGISLNSGAQEKQCSTMFCSNGINSPDGMVIPRCKVQQLQLAPGRKNAERPCNEAHLPVQSMTLMSSGL